MVSLSWGFVKITFHLLCFCVLFEQYLVRFPHDGDFLLEVNFDDASVVLHR